MAKSCDEYHSELCDTNMHSAEILHHNCYHNNLVTKHKQELSSCWDGRPFSHNRHGPKVGRGWCGDLGPHL